MVVKSSEQVGLVAGDVDFAIAAEVLKNIFAALVPKILSV